MRRLILLLLLLAAALSMTGCLTVTGDEPALQTPTQEPVQEPVQQEPVTVDVPETRVWSRQHHSVWGREPETVSVVVPGVTLHMPVAGSCV